MVVVGTNANMAAAYDIKTGNRVWFRELDGPSLPGPLLLGSCLAVFADSVYFLAPESGQIVQKFSWDASRADSPNGVGDDVIAILRSNASVDGVYKLVRLGEHSIRFTQTRENFATSLIYAIETNMIYVSHYEGLDVRRPNDGEIAFSITGKGVEAPGTPDVKDHAIYVATGDGFAYALNHPSIEKQ
jgi:outer membrane protein assembly factor BamB